MQLNREHTFEVSPDVLFQDVNGEIVLLDMAGENYFGLDEIGARIWHMLGAGDSVGAVLDALFDEYEVDRATLEQDVGSLIDELAGAGLIRLNA